MTMYRIEEARYNTDPWVERAMAEDLDFAKGLVRAWDTYDKYSYRVVDVETGEIVFSVLIPYEKSIDIGDPDWLTRLVADYGVPTHVFKEAIRRAVEKWNIDCGH